MDTSDVARNLWSLCSVLRDEGITFHEYVNELAPLLFFKFADDLSLESSIPDGRRWDNLRSSNDPLRTYKRSLNALEKANSRTIRELFGGHSTQIRSDRALSALLDGIDSVDWEHVQGHGLAEVYEALIDKNAQESRYGAGQYFTPRAVIDAIVRTAKPTPSDTVYDPAAGTAGFLVAAGNFAVSNDGSQPSLYGVELVREVYRICLMNLVLHGFESKIINADALSLKSTDRYSVCITNPPFGIKSSIGDTEAQLLEHPTSNKQLAFVQHVYMRMATEGRAAIIVPDNVLFESGTAASIRRTLLEKFRLHTVLHLPAGIFYATGVLTSVLFFSSGLGMTETVWFYDLREGNGTYGKRRRLTATDLDDFVHAFGDDAHGRSERRVSERFRSRPVSQIAAANWRLDKRVASTQGSGSSAFDPHETVALMRQEAAALATALEDIAHQIRAPEEVFRGAE